MTLEGKPERGPFDPIRVSPSRIDNLARCGVGFRMKYIDGVPDNVFGTFALFGTVVHKGLENWGVDRSQNLVDLMRAAWISETHEGPVVREFLAKYSEINVAVMQAEVRAKAAWETKNPGKESKAPRMTKFFKDDPACKALNQLLAAWLPKLEAGSPWKFDARDPLPQFYDDSLIIAKRYQRQWGHLPPVLHSEFEFNVQYHGFKLNGHIDGIELALDRTTGEALALLVNDYKTYKAQPAEFKDWRQLVMYDVAVREMVADGRLVLPEGLNLDTLPLRVGIDYVRFAGVECDWLSPAGSSRRYWEISEADHERLRRELDAYGATVAQGNFLPADKGQKADFCDFGPLCCLNSTSQAGGSCVAVEMAL